MQWRSSNTPTNVHPIHYIACAGNVATVQVLLDVSAGLEARTGIRLLYSAAIVKSKRFTVLIEAGGGRERQDWVPRSYFPTKASG